jgi:hypothetical protein
MNDSITILLQTLSFITKKCLQKSATFGTILIVVVIRLVIL